MINPISLLTLKWKIIIGAVAIAGIFLLIRWYGNRQWAKGETQGRQFMAMEMEKAKQKEWAAKEADIATQKASLTAAATQLERDRLTINRSLNDRLRAIQDAARATTGVVVPDSDLNSAIRAISGQLAATTR